jgi:hypothetical protein
MKMCETCSSEVQPRSKFCSICLVERRKKQDRNRKRQERKDGSKYAAVKDAQNAQRAIKRDWICKYLTDHPCVDCGEKDIVVLQFDHLGDEAKTSNVSRMVAGTYSLRSVQREVSKCAVRCANCHIRKTCERMGDTYRMKYLAPIV